MPELLPAVTEPPARKAGLSRVRPSMLESARGCSSRSTTIGSPLGCGTVTGTSWSAKRPDSMAATARCCETSAKASWSSRLTVQRSATFSAVSPIEYGWCISARAGLVKRQPSVVSAISRLPRSKGASALSWTYGARVIDSTPPATKTSPSPTMIAWAAALMACSPEPHRRLTVWPATSTGSPASSAAMRATLRLSSPAWLAQPRMTSSMRAGSMPALSTAALMASAARSSGRTVRNAPP